MVDQALLICETVDPSTSRSAGVSCTAYIEIKNDRENHTRGYEREIEGPYLVEKRQEDIFKTATNFIVK